MSWLLEALSFLDKKLGHRESKIIELPGEPDGCYGVVDENGVLHDRIARIDPLELEFSTLKSLCEWVALDHIEKLGGIFVHQNCVTYYSNIDDRKRSAVLPLHCNPVLMALDKGSYGGQSQERFIDSMFDLTPYLHAKSSLMAFARNLKWSSKKTSSGVVNDQKESFGSEIEREVVSKVEYPDEVKLIGIPLFLDYKVDICCRIKVSIARETLSLIPVHGEIQRVINDGIEKVVQEIGSNTTDVTIFRGYAIS